MELQLRTGQDLVDKALARVWSQLNRLVNVVTSDYLVNDVTLGTGDTIVTHGLRRAPTGFIVVQRNAAQVVYRPDAATTAFDPTTQIILRAGGAVKVTLLFF